MNDSSSPARADESEQEAVYCSPADVRLLRHAGPHSKYVVIDDVVYDVTDWIYRHPGGRKVIAHYVGQDATEAFKTFHTDVKRVNERLKTLRVGRILSDRHEDDCDKDEQLRKDFRELRETAERMGLFRPSVCFYVLSISFLVVFEILAYLMLYRYGNGWIPWTASVLCYTVLQGQASWCQHDFGHLSVFHYSWLNRLLHIFFMNFVKGASASWWRHLHNQHHAKPNVMSKDPDIAAGKVFVFGQEMPREAAKNRTRSLPYNWQHIYFAAISPPLLFPVFFQVMIFRHAITRRQWIDLSVTMLFYVKLFALYAPLLGLWGTVKFYFLVRCLESQWFVWVSQCNHIPMDITFDRARPWFSLQLLATCNVEKSFFNDWFTGHLNLQIEHHLFPTMPRHNLYKITPYVKALCAKHKIPYIVKPLSTAFGDIIRSLKKSGDLWQKYSKFYKRGNKSATSTKKQANDSNEIESTSSWDMQ